MPWAGIAKALHPGRVEDKGLAGVGFLTTIPMQDLGPGSCQTSPLTGAGPLLLVSSLANICHLETPQPSHRWPLSRGAHFPRSFDSCTKAFTQIVHTQGLRARVNVNLAVCLPGHIGYSLGFVSKQALTCLLYCKDGVKTWFR